ncbi:hypothetical protein JZK55_02270 [Dissulfurispira thermophila]|uniref:Uncharacterized protein n=2 Tax=root TaxID=1 RepID=A0A7G1GY23_9BACT|nr:hypothetical protein [Dissulfurispira thermophila]BCB95305.1 hypothetical protein JZK55_02270 [Dissulfurispira thermophila]
MKCKYLNQFRLSEFGWTVESCTANDRPYAPSISELHDYCNGNEVKRCPVWLKREGLYTAYSSPFIVEIVQGS